MEVGLFNMLTEKEIDRWDELEALDRELTEEEDFELDGLVDKAYED